MTKLNWGQHFGGTWIVQCYGFFQQRYGLVFAGPAAFLFQHHFGQADKRPPGCITALGQFG